MIPTPWHCLLLDMFDSWNVHFSGYLGFQLYLDTPLLGSCFSEKLANHFKFCSSVFLCCISSHGPAWSYSSLSSHLPTGSNNHDALPQQTGSSKQLQMKFSKITNQNKPFFLERAMKWKNISLGASCFEVNFWVIRRSATQKSQIEVKGELIKK